MAGARHGLKASAKLARIECQESRTSSPSFTSKSTPVAESTETPPTTEKKKRRKKSVDQPAPVSEREVLPTSLSTEVNLQTESNTKKEKKKKKRSLDPQLEIAVTEGLILVEPRADDGLSDGPPPKKKSKKHKREKEDRKCDVTEAPATSQVKPCGTGEVIKKKSKKKDLTEKSVNIDVGSPAGNMENKKKKKKKRDYGLESVPSEQPCERSAPESKPEVPPLGQDVSSEKKEKKKRKKLEPNKNVLSEKIDYNITDKTSSCVEEVIALESEVVTKLKKKKKTKESC